MSKMSRCAQLSNAHLIFSFFYSKYDPSFACSLVKIGFLCWYKPRKSKYSMIHKWDEIRCVYVCISWPIKHNINNDTTFFFLLFSSIFIRSLFQLVFFLSISLFYLFLYVCVFLLQWFVERIELVTVFRLSFIRVFLYLCKVKREIFFKILLSYTILIVNGAFFSSSSSLFLYLAGRCWNYRHTILFAWNLVGRFGIYIRAIKGAWFLCAYWL